MADSVDEPNEKTNIVDKGDNGTNKKDKYLGFAAIATIVILVLALVAVIWVLIVVTHRNGKVREAVKQELGNMTNTTKPAAATAAAPTSHNCASNPCKNAGNCSEGAKTFMCSCQAPFQGLTCQGLNLAKLPSSAASQSGIHPSAVNHTHRVASTAIDGSTNQVGNQSPFCATTNMQEKPWWQVNMGRKCNISGVSLLSRYDAGTKAHQEAYDKRFSQLNIRVGDTSAKDGGNTKNALCTFRNKTIHADHFININCNSPVRGQYLIVQSNLTSAFFELCEVRVNATC